jgi:hypothetical protein
VTIVRNVLGGTRYKDCFAIAVGEAAQDAVWLTPHPLTHRLADDDPRGEKYLREYQLSVGRRVLAAIEKVWAASESWPSGYNPSGIFTNPHVSNRAKA